MLVTPNVPQSLHPRTVIEGTLQGRTRRTYRVIAIDEAEDKIWLLEITDKRPESRGPEQWTLSRVRAALGSQVKCIEDRIRLPRMDARGSPLTKEERTARYQRLRVLGPLRWACNELALCKKKQRAELIKKRAKKTGVNIHRIYKVLLLYHWFGMDWNAMLPLHTLKGSPGESRLGGKTKKGHPTSHRLVGTKSGYDGVNVRKRDLANFEQALRIYHIEEDRTLVDTYELMSSTMYARHYKGKDGKTYTRPLRPELIPSLNQFYYHAERIINDKGWKAEKHGRLEYLQHHASYAGNAADICLGPCDIFDTDCSTFKVDCQLYTGQDHQVIKQKTICFVVDRYSYAITGFFAFSGPESWDIYRQALFVAFSDKSTLCKSADIDPELWKIHHLPNKIFVDRGPARSHDAHESLVNGLKIARAIAPPREAQLKAVVENVQGILQKRLASLPGGTHRTQRIRDKDKAKKSLDGPLPTSQELNDCIVAAIVEHNQFMDASHLRTAAMLKDGVAPNPAAIFEWGLVNSVGTYRRTIPQQDVYVALLRTMEVSLQASGIEYKKAWFQCPEIMAYRQHVHKTGKSPRITVRHDPIRRVLYWIGPDASLVAIPMKRQSERKYEAMDWEDIEEFIPYERMSVTEQKLERRSNNYLSKRQMKVIENAAKRFDETTPSIRAAGKRNISESKKRQRSREEKELKQAKDDLMASVDAMNMPVRECQEFCVSEVTGEFYGLVTSMP